MFFCFIPDFKQSSWITNFGKASNPLKYVFLYFAEID